MFNAIAIARHIVVHLSQDVTKDRLSIMKLLKLVYIMHGGYLALKKEPLIQEEVEAWVYGPVIRELYVELKECNTRFVHKEFFSDRFEDTFDEITQSILKKIFNQYQDFDAWELSDMTHKKGTPWDQVYSQGQNNFIPNKLIQKYYEPEDTKYILNTEDKFKNIFEEFNEKLDDFISKSEINYNKFYK